MGYSLSYNSPIFPLLSYNIYSFSSVQFSHSVVSDSATPQTAARQASLSITNSWSLLKLMSIKSVMPSNHLILCFPLLLLPSIFSSIRIFSNELALHIRWPKYWSFSFSISPSNEHPGLISFRMDWLDFLAVQGTLKSLPQRHSSKASILLGSAFFNSPTLTSKYSLYVNNARVGSPTLYKVENPRITYHWSSIYLIPPYTQFHICRFNQLWTV